MEFLRKTIKVGNSSGVILPKKLLGSEVRIIVVNQPIDIKKEVMKLLDIYLADLIGVYVTNKNPVEALAISTNIKKIIEKEKIKISIIPLNIIKRDIKNPALKNKLIKAETILNNALLSDLRKQIKAN